MSNAITFIKITKDVKEVFHTSDQIDQVFHTLLQSVGPSRDVISISTPHPHPVPSKSSNKVLAAIFHPFASSLASRQFWSPNEWVTSSKLASFCESPIFQCSTILSASQIAHLPFPPKSSQFPTPHLPWCPMKPPTQTSNQRC